MKHGGEDELIEELRAIRWYKRGEKEPEMPCVFANAQEGHKLETFTAVFFRNQDAVRMFIATDAWTHWHPLSPLQEE